MIKVAIFSCGDLSNMKGVMNYVQEKARRLKEINELSCDVFIIRSVQSRVFSFLVNGYKPSVFFRKKKIKDTTTIIDNVVYHNLWHTYTLWDNILNTKVLKRPQGFFFSRKCVNRLKHYDIIATHDISCHFIAEKLHKTYGIPYVATWHGSDINLADKNGQKHLCYVQHAIEMASCNLFVSKALLDASEKITKKGHKEVIYTGPSPIFEKYSKNKRLELRTKYHVENKKVVAFVGNLFPIKNVMVIPDIFKRVDELSNEPVEFWVVGDGKLEGCLKDSLVKTKVSFKMFGKKQPEEMPEIMNIIDVLVLPSLNEGLPLVTLEAMKCGAHVVGSDVGGISEAIGKENVFKLDSDFVENVSQRILFHLNNAIPVGFPVGFSWKLAIEKEIGLYKEALSII